MQSGGLRDLASVHQWASDLTCKRVARRYVAASSRICDVIAPAPLPVMSSIASPITVTSSSESWAFQGVSPFGTSRGPTTGHHLTGSCLLCRTPVNMAKLAKIRST